MAWSTYKKYRVGYNDGDTAARNAVPRYNNYVGWYLYPTWTNTSLYLYDNYIVFWALNDEYMHDIFQDTLDTPVAVAGVAANPGIVPS